MWKYKIKQKIKVQHLSEENYKTIKNHRKRRINKELQLFLYEYSL